MSQIQKIINKNYNNIPHFSTSKLTQQAGRKILTEQEKVLTKGSSNWDDLIIVTEKVDGANMGDYRFFIDAKMEYNKSRKYKHGKEY